MLAACRPSALLTCLSAGPLAAAAWVLPITEENHLVWLVCGGSAAVLLWLLGLRGLKHALWAELVVYARKIGDKFSRS
jgi:hypothetical protein